MKLSTENGFTMEICQLYLSNVGEIISSKANLHNVYNDMIKNPD